MLVSNDDIWFFLSNKVSATNLFVCTEFNHHQDHNSLSIFWRARRQVVCFWLQSTVCIPIENAYATLNGSVLLKVCNGRVWKPAKGLVGEWCLAKVTTNEIIHTHALLWSHFMPFSHIDKKIYSFTFDTTQGANNTRWHPKISFAVNCWEKRSSQVTSGIPAYYGILWKKKRRCSKQKNSGIPSGCDENEILRKTFFFLFPFVIVISWRAKNIWHSFFWCKKVLDAEIREQYILWWQRTRVRERRGKHCEFHPLTHYTYLRGTAAHSNTKNKMCSLHAMRERSITNKYCKYSMHIWNVWKIFHAEYLWISFWQECKPTKRKKM